MRIISWNVNGFRAIWQKGFPDFINSDNPDIFCLQETKMQPDQVTDDMKYFLDYSPWFHSAERKGYSGVATYSKIKPLEIKPGLSGWNDNEGRVLMSRFEQFTLFNIYFPNGQKDETRLRYKLDFYDAALKYFNTLRDRGHSLIITGDYNTAHHPIDLARPKENESVSGFLPIERAWLDKLVGLGYIDTWRHCYPETANKYSWWSFRSGARPRNVGWRIDYFFITPDLLPKLSGAFILDEVEGSDHCPLGIEIDL